MLKRQTLASMLSNRAESPCSLKSAARSYALLRRANDKRETVVREAESRVGAIKELLLGWERSTHSRVALN